jgi:hypothetical protein
MNALAGRLMRPAGRPRFVTVRSPDVGAGANVGEVEEEVEQGLANVEETESGDKSLERELALIKEVRLPHGPSNNEESLLTGDSGAMVDADVGDMA